MTDQPPDSLAAIRARYPSRKTTERHVRAYESVRAVRREGDAFYVDGALTVGYDVAEVYPGKEIFIWDKATRRYITLEQAIERAKWRSV